MMRFRSLSMILVAISSLVLSSGLLRGDDHRASGPTSTAPRTPVLIELFTSEAALRPTSYSDNWTAFSRCQRQTLSF